MTLIALWIAFNIALFAVFMRRARRKERNEHG